MRTPRLASWALLALVAAGLLGPRIATPTWVPLACLGAGIMALLCAVPARRRVRGALVSTAIVLVAAGAGGVRFADATLEAFASRGEVDIVAVVADEPRVHEHGWWTLVRMQEVDDMRVRALALLRSGDETGSRPPILGSVWRGRGRLRPVVPDGFGAYLLRRYVTAEVLASHWVAERPPNGLAAASEFVRARVRTAAARRLPGDHAGLAVGLVTGDTRQLSDAAAEDMRATGLTHLVAVSGSNVAVVAGGVAAAVRWLPVGAAARRGLVAAALLWFAFLTRWEPSVLRATAMAGIVLLAAARGRLTDGRHALAGAVLVIVLIDPGAAASPGLLLSAAAAGGVLVLAPRILPRVRALPRAAAAVVAAALAAQIAVAPVLLAAVGSVPLASVPANLVAVPAAAMASAVAAVAAAAATLHPGFGALLFSFARPATAVVLGVSRRLAGDDFVVHAGSPVAVVALGAAVVWLLARRRRVRVASFAVAMGCFAVLAAPTVALHRPVRDLVVTAIDVGQGDAIVVESPRVRMLVDGGPDPDAAAAWLAGARRRDLDLVVLTHPHADHAGGLPTVLTRGRVGAVWMPDIDRPVGAAVVRAAHEHDVAVATPAAGAVVSLADVTLEVLAPPPGHLVATDDEEINNASVVLRVSWHGRAVLLTGDAQAASQRRLLAAPSRLRAGLLKVPHHGGDTNAEGFLAATGARTAVIPVGRDNDYGHPADAVLDELGRLGVNVRRTDLEGTIRTVVPPTGPEVDASDSRGWDRPLAARPLPSPRHEQPRGRLSRHRRRRASRAARGRRPPRRTSRPHPRSRRRRRRRRGCRGPPRVADRHALRRDALRRRARHRVRAWSTREGG